jgi:hypothetical protein
MAKRKDIEITGGEAAASSSGAPAPALAKSELPSVESPPISPATETPAIEPIAAATPAVEPIMDAAPVANPRFVLRPRHKRYALLAASVTFAAALGAVVGALASGGFSAPARPDVAAIEENKAMQQSIARLGKEITTLKTSLDQANKTAHTQIAKISERLEHATSEVTGSISAPQTTAPVLAPLPSPRPAQRFAAVEPPPPDHPLLQTKNCFVTPHIAWATRAARARLLAAAVENVKAFLAGRPENAVGTR